MRRTLRRLSIGLAATAAAAASLTLVAPAAHAVSYTHLTLPTIYSV